MSWIYPGQKQEQERSDTLIEGHLSKADRDPNGDRGQRSSHPVLQLVKSAWGKSGF